LEFFQVGDSLAIVPTLPAALKILVCDSHRPTRNVTQLLLADEFDVSTAGTIEEALALAPQCDVILLDPDFCGRRRGSALLRQIRSEAGESELTIIASTGHFLPADKEEFLSNGFDVFQGKPFLKRQLV